MPEREALYPNADAIQRAMLAKNPELEDINGSIFAGRPRAQQFTRGRRHCTKRPCDAPCHLFAERPVAHC